MIKSTLVENPLEKRFQRLEERVSRIEKLLSKGNIAPKTSGIEKLIVENVEDISTQHLVVITLKLKSKQTRQEIKKTLEDWGKVVGDWFKGGNMNNRLIKMSIVKRDGVNEKNDELFLLTKKGELLADELIEKIKIKSH